MTSVTLSSADIGSSPCARLPPRHVNGDWRSTDEHQEQARAGRGRRGGRGRDRRGQRGRGLGGDRGAGREPINGPVHGCVFQTVNGHYLTAVGGGGRTTDTIHSDATWVGSWEKFTVSCGH